MRSKRERKQRSNSQKTSKRKAAALSNALESFAPDDLRGATPEPPSQGEDTNVLILETKGTKPASDAAPHNAAAPAKRLSKSQKRKLRKIEEDKAKRAERAQVLKTLASNELSSEELALLQPSSMIGQKLSKRQKLRHALACQRLGLEAPDNALLEVERPVPSADIEAERPRVDVQAPHQARGMPDGSASEDDDRALSEDEYIVSDQTAQPRASMPLAEQRQLAQSIRQQMDLPPDEDEEGMKERRASHAHAGPTRVVTVQRQEHIQEARAGLPVLGMEQEIMEAITGNDVCLLCGETGSGKTTQVPQFLYEAGYGSKQFPERAGRIGVTQPRRVAAIAAARRVAEELSCSIGGAVGYQVRYDRQVSEDTAVKFMTDGILLRELQSDLLLRSYSVLVLDEAHERSLNTDLLLGLLSRVVPLRKQMAEQGGDVLPLKLIIMSATLRVEDFAANTKLFPTPPPIIQVPARQYPVTVHFCRRTELYDYVGAAFGKVVQIHERLTPGGILVFMTGQREVEHLCARLRAKYAKSQHAPSKAAVQPGSEQKAEDTSADPLGGFGADEAEQAAEVEEPLQATEDDYDVEEALEEEEETVTLGGDQFTPEQIAVAEAAFIRNQGDGAPKADDASKDQPGEERAGSGPVHVLPLYAMLPGGAQDAVFRAVPSGHRLIIVATNVAETSLTIPGIRYVVDAGRAKEKVLDSHGAAARFKVTWISKASAEQRAGRAGRTGPGHCYRLYSSAHFNDSFPQHSDPEVLKTPLEGVALIMKAMGIDKVLHFPFPTTPDRDALAAAERTLSALGALDADGALTERGRAMAALPLDPRPSRMILQAAEDALTRKRSETIVTAAVALAAVVSGESPFIHVDSIQAMEGEGVEKLKSRKQTARAAHRRLRIAQSDALNALSAFVSWLGAQNKELFCREHYLHAKNLREAAALHSQLLRQLAGGALLPGIALPRSPPAPELPSQKVLLLLQRAIAAGWADQVARRVHSLEYVQGHAETESGRTRAVRYMAQALPDNVFLHPQSALAKTAPEFVVYSQILRTEKRPYLAGVTEVEARWLPEVAQPLIRLSGPLEDPPPHYSIAADAVVTTHNATYGQHEWLMPAQERPCTEAALQARHFAAALLDGAVLPSMAVLRDRLAASPASAAAPYSQGQKRVALLVHALVSAQVFSRAALARAYAQNPAFLKLELQAWLQKDAVAVLESTWPTLLSEAKAAAPKKGAQPVGKRKHSTGLR